ncbi:MAG: HAMP domain-containing histidine kinase [Bacteroidales bacterium]|nr:HAMP domain-containing histidine kinase [Bacteroidales bacterium]
MKRKLFIWLIGIFIAAASCLVVVEFIQATRTVRMSNRLFSISVNNAMDDMIDQLNRLKLEDYISQNDRYRLLKFKRIDELNNRMQTLVQENYNLFFDTTLVAVGGTMIDSVHLLPHARVSSADSATIAQYNTLLATRDRLAGSPDFYDRFVNDISDYVVDNIMMPSTFNYNLLDSLIIQNLIANGIDLQPIIGVYDNGNAQFLYCNRSGKELSLLESPYKYRFQLDGMMNPTDYFLVLYFPLPGMLLHEDSAFAFLFRALLIAIIFTLFLLLVRMMSRQHELDQMKNDFINNMTHEIKTPISTIGLACEMLQDNTIVNNPENTKTYIGIIDDANRRMRTLTETILESAKMTDRHATVDKKEVDIHAIIHTVVRGAQLRVDSRGGQLSCHLHADPSTILASEVHITNLLFNLVDNAIKYSPNEVLIDITTSTQGNNIVLEVTDHGIGIDPKQQKHIFEKFYRVPTGDVHNIKGFGIGLNYVKQVVALHHGTITVESTPGQGSTFRVSLPTN